MGEQKKLGKRGTKKRRKISQTKGRNLSEYDGLRPLLRAALLY